ncbi:MAG TPA: hypothetical protein VFF78_08320 [Anaerolineaceae bacterium]|nr:hypothetical protein [Anaerolineaceae bacterium]
MRNSPAGTHTNFIPSAGEIQVWPTILQAGGMNSSGSGVEAWVNVGANLAVSVEVAVDISVSVMVGVLVAVNVLVGV